jgi:hypothetical protein
VSTHDRYDKSDDGTTSVPRAAAPDPEGFCRGHILDDHPPNLVPERHGASCFLRHAKERRENDVLPDFSISRPLGLRRHASSDLLPSFEMKLPGGQDAVVEIAKLRDYCLNPAHPRGHHKARVFASALGLTSADAEFLYVELLRAAREAEAIRGGADEYGERFNVDLELARKDRRARVRSAWIVRRGERVPRLTSCYVLLD